MTIAPVGVGADGGREGTLVVARRECRFPSARKSQAQRIVKTALSLKSEYLFS